MKTQETPSPFHADVADSLRTTDMFNSLSSVEIQELERQVD